ncbi:MAG: toxin, partial [Deltaproteobacteria bacterium]|nr:toxin [Deltaproteobacteria bacterium]
MAGPYQDQVGQHAAKDAHIVKHAELVFSDTLFKYKFENFFHPFVGELIEKLSKESLLGLLNSTFHEELRNDTSNNPEIDNVNSNVFFFKNFGYGIPPEVQQKYPLVQVKGFPKEIDVRSSGPYANYNWEMLFHIPVTIAVHLSKNQRFAEAQRWFHYIFDPTCNDTSIPKPERYWKFLAFRKKDSSKQLDEILRLLSIAPNDLTPAERLEQEDVLNGYIAILNKPFRPHAVARTRHLAYQYCVVMKYLDNLIAWGDHLFRQDTMESISEATQIYVLAANVLGERPQRIPPGGTVKPKTFKQLKDQGLGPIGNAIVELEGQFPFNFGLPQTQGVDPNAADSLFGIGPALYFCTPRNEKLLGYWDTVADRLFKIRHCMNIEGVVRQLALFDPPIDPGMLVKAVAAGIDIGSIISGLNQPTGPVRSLFLIQKALELAGEVRGLGSALLSAIEKGDGEHMALLRQGHEIKIQQMMQEVRFLQWKQAQESTESLLRGRASALERYYYYQRLLGLIPDKKNAPDTFPLDRRELAEENFDEAYGELVGQYEKTVKNADYPPIDLKTEGRLKLHVGEYDELIGHADRAFGFRAAASVNDAIVQGLSLIPDAVVVTAPMGGGTLTEIFGGTKLAHVGRAVTSNLN